MELPRISVITASKDKDTPKLSQSIRRQDYPQELIEHIVITEGNPESAKAIGLKKAKGDLICIVASDCVFPSKRSFYEAVLKLTLTGADGAYSAYYAHNSKDPMLNRYFSLFGCNDPVPLYLGKNDRMAWYETYKKGILNFPDKVPTLGDNGFFIWKEILLKADIEHYSHIDVCEDLRKQGYYKYVLLGCSVHHQTGDSLWNWIKKRIHYSRTLNVNRRWEMIRQRDLLKLFYFLLSSVTFIEPLIRSMIGYVRSGKRDKAWFLHPFMCPLTCLIYLPTLLRKGGSNA